MCQCGLNVLRGEIRILSDNLVNAIARGVEVFDGFHGNASTFYNPFVVCDGSIAFELTLAIRESGIQTLHGLAGVQPETMM